MTTKVETYEIIGEGHEYYVDTHDAILKAIHEIAEFYATYDDGESDLSVTESGGKIYIGSQVIAQRIED